MKLADEPLAPKKKAKSKVKLAAKAKKAKKRGAIGTATLMTRAYWGSLFDPAYSPFPKKKNPKLQAVFQTVFPCRSTYSRRRSCPLVHRRHRSTARSAVVQQDPGLSLRLRLQQC